MPCPVCGNQADPSNQFCGACGSPLGGPPAPAAPPPAAPPPAYSPPPVQASPVVGAPPGYGQAMPVPPGYPPQQPGYPPPQPGYPPPPGYVQPGFEYLAPVGQQPGRPAGPRSTPTFLSGDWAGAATANAMGVGAMLGMSLFVAIIIASARPSSFKVSQLVAGLFEKVGEAAGGWYGNENSSVYLRPLGLTVVGYGLIAAYFVRRVRRTGPLTAAGVGLQAARVGIIHFGALLVISLLSLITSQQGHLQIFSTLFYGSVTLGIALFVACVVALPGVLPANIEHYRGLVAGPVRAVLFLGLVSCAATALFVLALVLTGTVRETGPFASMLAQSGVTGGSVTADWRGVLICLVAYLPMVAGWTLMVGMGVPMSATGATDSPSILDIADGQTLFLVWPVVTILLLVLAGRYSARHSPRAASGRPIGWWLAAVLPVTLFVLALTVSIRADTGGRGHAVGPDLLFVLLLGGLYGIGVGMLGTVLVPRQAPKLASYAMPGYAAPPGYPPAGGIPAQPGPIPYGVPAEPTVQQFPNQAGYPPRT